MICNTRANRHICWCTDVRLIICPSLHHSSPAAAAFHVPSPLLSLAGAWCEQEPQTHYTTWIITATDPLIYPRFMVRTNSGKILATGMNVWQCLDMKLTLSTLSWITHNLRIRPLPREQNGKILVEGCILDTEWVSMPWHEIDAFYPDLNNSSLKNGAHAWGRKWEILSGGVCLTVWCSAL